MTDTATNPDTLPQTHGYSNRFIRMARSRHTRDLQLITRLIIYLGLPIIVAWIFFSFFNKLYAPRLDEVLQRYYAVSSSLARQCSPDWQKKLDRTQSALANARHQLPLITTSLWKYVSQPLTTLAFDIGKIETDLHTIDALQLPDFKCSKLTSPASLSHFDDNLNSLLASAERLTATLTSVSVTQGLFSFLTAIAALGTVLLGFGGWLYRTADSRLTVIDLIASEIFSICRAAANNRSVSQLIKAYETGDTRLFVFLGAEERYDDTMKSIGMNLGFFDQYTISRVIDYYTSLKILFDRIRMLKAWVADVEGKYPERRGAQDLSFKLTSEERNILRGILKQIIYDCFICLENARVSLHCLLEKGTFHDQSIFVCLLSEIRAFAFSRSCPDNVEYLRRRLAARLPRQSIRSEERIEGMIDEFERYSHPAYRESLQILCEEYHRYYENEKGVGSDIVATLCGRSSPVEIDSGILSREIEAAAC
jgi:hypothetical protein